VNRPARYVIKLGATALLVGAVAVGCAGHDRGAANGHTSSSPAATAAQTDAAEALPPAPVTTVAEATPAPADSPAPGDSTASTGPANAPGATADPLDTNLSDLDQLLNGVNSALSGSDASASGGE
jgi:pyruvate/2-oxoglutarate dehydrogenase complex dihydrolipoamide acyltransferase (E2) component